MNTTKNRIRKAKTPDTIQVVVPAASLLDVMRRYRRMTWPVTVTIRDHNRGGTLFFLRNRRELEDFGKCAGDLQVAYFGKVRGEMAVDFGKNVSVTVRYRAFRKARGAELLSPTETARYFLYRTGDLKEPGSACSILPRSSTTEYRYDRIARGSQIRVQTELRGCH